MWSILTCPAYNITSVYGPRRNTVLLLPCSVAYRWHDVFHCCMHSHRHRLRRKHHSSVVYWPLPSNGRLLWLNNSCFERICHNIIVSSMRVTCLIPLIFIGFITLIIFDKGYRFETRHYVVLSSPATVIWNILLVWWKHFWSYLVWQCVIIFHSNCYLQKICIKVSEVWKNVKRAFPPLFYVHLQDGWFIKQHIFIANINSITLQKQN
jgi:hypothetical protein